MKESPVSKKSRGSLLVTTAIEESWGSGKPLVFLGEWCRLYNRRGVWKKLPHQVVRNHWDDRKKLRADHDYLSGLHDLLLANLVQVMNSYHRIERPLRYWQMILDPWLLTYVAVIWDRWEYLRLAFEEHDQLETIALEWGTYKPSFDCSDFLRGIDNDLWNHYLFLEIIQSNYSKQCNISRLPVKPQQVADLDSASSNKPRGTLKHKIAKIVDRWLGRLSARNEVMFFHSYFPPAALVRLNLNLKQTPRLYLNEFDWPVPRGSLTASNSQGLCRENISLDVEAKNAFEAFLFGRIFRDMPSVYVERFSSLQVMACQLPMNPKVIMTANAHWHNELFKVWSAEQVMRGVKLVTMVHGGSFPPLFGAMYFEEDIADIRTTAAAPYHPKHVKLPSNKLAGRKFISSKRFCAVVGNEMPRYSRHGAAVPISGQSLVGYNMVCELYSLLSDEIKEFFLVKPYPDRGWNTRQRYIDKLGRDKVSDEENYYRFLSNARVIVCTYPQTTFSEAMASGLPSILFYPAHLWETISELDPLLESLRAAKIVFHCPKMAAAHINTIWEDPDQWWNSEDVLKARKEFNSQAVELDTGWLKKWATFINDVDMQCCESKEGSHERYL